MHHAQNYRELIALQCVLPICALTSGCHCVNDIGAWLSTLVIMSLAVPAFIFVVKLNVDAIRLSGRAVSLTPMKACHGATRRIDKTFICADNSRQHDPSTYSYSVPASHINNLPSLLLLHAQ